MSAWYGKAILVLMIADMTVVLTFYAGKDRVHISKRRRKFLTVVAAWAATQAGLGALEYYAFGTDPSQAQTLAFLATLTIFLVALVGRPVRREIKRSLTQAIGRLRG